MNFIQNLSPSTFRTIKNVGKVLKLQQILIIPITSKSEDPIVLYARDNDLKKGSIFNNLKLVSYLFDKYTSKSDPYEKSKIESHNLELKFEKINPYMVQLGLNNISALMLYDKGVETEKSWTPEEMDILNMVSQLIREDFSGNQGKPDGKHVEDYIEQKKRSYQILELQYRLPLQNSLQLLKNISESVLGSSDEVHFYLNRTIRLLESADEIVKEVQENIWGYASENKSTAIDKVHVEKYMRNCVSKHESESVEIYYGHVKSVNETHSLEIYIRKILLDKVLNALLDNAVKFSKGGVAEIYVTTEINNVDLIITVRDMGIGIPSDDIKLVSEPFFRASNNTHSKGLGVELSIIKRMITEYGGSITFSSVENEFTEVVCNLPYLVNGLQDNDDL